jgi:hypothetical protein
MQAAEAFAHTASTQAMRLPGSLIAFVLVVLLASTTPVGTGSGAHQFDLLHPLFSHVHVVNGRVVTHEEQLAEQSSGHTGRGPSSAPSFGAGSGGAAVDAGIGLTPTVPTDDVAPVWNLATLGSSTELHIPRGRKEAPPDPPPL